MKVIPPPNSINPLRIKEPEKKNMSTLEPSFPRCFALYLPVSSLFRASISWTPFLPSNITTNQDAIMSGSWAHPSLRLVARWRHMPSSHWLMATWMEMRMTGDSARSPRCGPVAHCTETCEIRRSGNSWAAFFSCPPPNFPGTFLISHPHPA